MLKHLQSHQGYLDTQRELLESVPPEALKEYSETIQIFRHPNFDAAHDVLHGLYSHTGRPALVQIEILRAYVLAAHLKVSWERLLFKMEIRAVFRAIIGIELEQLPTLPSFLRIKSSTHATW